MILVDTSVWVAHFRTAEPDLVALLSRNQVLVHPHVIAEIALGSVGNRSAVLHLLGNMPAAVTASHVEVMTFIDNHKLANTGVGYVDAALLASTALTSGATLWARDKNLRAAAVRSRLAAKGMA
ncbi:MAG TPA: type II toxin-antitoxin system VapC family toxin [Vitreimonas sp.]|nr:type II toxin-antitoxin system VapC family toxin [Vitreimonas sp.]